jgi:hypothetical protein
MTENEIREAQARVWARLVKRLHLPERKWLYLWRAK